MSKLNISQAARAVGVSRSTFYRHIENKGISTTKDDDGNPLVDTAELMRVYGTLQDKTAPAERPTRQRGAGGSGQDMSALERKLYEAQAALDIERVRREAEQERREQAEESALKWQAQAERLTLLLSDRRDTSPGKPQRSFWERVFSRPN